MKFNRIRPLTRLFYKKENIKFYSKCSVAEEQQKQQSYTE